MLFVNYLHTPLENVHLQIEGVVPMKNAHPSNKKTLLGGPNLFKLNKGILKY